MKTHSISAWLLFACVPYLPVAHCTERVGDASYAYAFEQLANAVTALEDDCLASIESTPEEGRFNLYRNYNQLAGTWVQVEFLQTLLDLAIASTSRLDEAEIRTMLRDHAQYVLWELDHAIADLEANAPDANQLNQLWVNVGIRSLLSNVKLTVNRLLVDQCADAPCAVAH